MTVYENVITGLVLLALFILGYCKLSQKSLMDVIIEIKEGFSGGVEDVQEVRLKWKMKGGKNE